MGHPNLGISPLYHIYFPNSSLVCLSFFCESSVPPVKKHIPTIACRKDMTTILMWPGSQPDALAVQLARDDSDGPLDGYF